MLRSPFDPDPRHRAQGIGVTSKLLAVSIALLCPLASCGAASSAASSPSSSSSGDSDTGAHSAEAERGPRCQQDDCLPCGEGFCPRGFYCDASQPAGPSCAWLPACATEADCGCLGPALGAACSCEQRGSLAHVQCR